MRPLSQLEIEIFDGALCVELPCGADVCTNRGGGWRVTCGGRSFICYLPAAVLCTVYDLCGCAGCSLPCCAREGTAADRLRDEVQARRDELDAKRRRLITDAIFDRNILHSVYDFCTEKGYIDRLW